jgi:ribosomal protein S12 methylthiotransferase
LVDSELILGKLDPSRYELAESISRCDVALLNTCAFIQDAQEESVDQILRLIELKRQGDIGKLVVMGCLVQRFARELQEELSEVDAFVGSGEYGKIPDIVRRVASEERVEEIGVPGYLYTSAERRVSLTPLYSRYLKISEGCDHSCSFCVIPSFRGRHRSRRLGDVVKEAEQLASEGARELVLTGQDTTFYGYDLEGRFLLPGLLQELNQIPALRWIRILYAYPSLVSEALIGSIASLDKVCHYLDMPLQHVNDRILKSMRRGTTGESIRSLVKKLRSRIPDLAIRTTFIVGYPGEGDREFQELVEFIEETRFERLGIFSYSAEEGSAAKELSGQVSEKIKANRLDIAMRLQQRVSRENNRRLLGKRLEVLLEEPSGDEPGAWIGRTYMDAPEVDGTVVVRSATGPLKPGDFVAARIEETREYDLVGEVVTSQSA